MITETIKTLCSYHRISIAELEKKLKFGNGTIRRWDKNMPSIDKITKVAQYFDIPQEDILSCHEQLVSSIDKNTIGGRIHELRRSKRILQRELALAINTITSTIVKYEHNVIKPSEEILEKIANYFEVDKDYLLTGEGEHEVAPLDVANIDPQYVVDDNYNEINSLLNKYKYKISGKQSSDLAKLVKWYFDMISY